MGGVQCLVLLITSEKMIGLCVGVTGRELSIGQGETP